MRKILALTRKEFIQTFRDKRMLPIIFVAPIVQLIFLGYAVTTDVKHIYIKIWDMDKSPQSRNIINSIVNCGYFDNVGIINNDKDMKESFKKNKCDFVIYIPSDFSRKIKRLEKAKFEIIADGSDSNLTMIGLNYLNEIINRENAYYQKEVMEKKSGLLGRYIKTPQITLNMKVRYNPELESSHYMIPGVVCLILTLTTMFLTSMALTKEKEMGTIEQIIVSPIKSYEIIIGKTLPFVIFGMLDVVFIMSIGMIIFNVPIRGSVVLLGFSSLLFILTTLGLGIFISTISKTQQQAMLTSFIFVFPAMILSGFVFPISNMPIEVQYLSYLVPVRYFLTIIRMIVLKGVGIDVLWPEILALIIFGIVIFTFSSLRFKKKLG
jgi:ABC-2 type transport system permease protein